MRPEQKVMPWADAGTRIEKQWTDGRWRKCMFEVAQSDWVSGMANRDSHAAELLRSGRLGARLIALASMATAVHLHENSFEVEGNGGSGALKFVTERDAR